jgi:acyl carrier protein
VGRGYLHEPQKTTQAFIPDPFSSEPSARLYKTGDLACYRSDGVLEFLGRVDYQVKVRGFRIELGEIEALLERHPAVRQAVAMVREDTPGEQHLVAYVVPGQEQALTPGDLRDLLREQLPDYMVPSAFVLLGALPLTPNGKVDRRALPAPDTSQLARLAEFVAPETPLEKRLAEIWTEVLGIEQIGIYDDFFDLGGHSLIATQLIYRINKVFGVNLSVRKLFLTESNIANLALLVEETLIEMLEERARRRASEATGSTEGAYA